MRHIIKKIFFKKNSSQNQENVFSDFSSEELEVFSKVSPYTMTSIERVKALMDSVNYISRNNLDGDIVECGVWKGGSILATLLQLKKNGNEKTIWMYDTFEGMSEPTEFDIDNKDRSASQRMAVEDKFTSNVWAYSTLNEVKSNLNQVEDHNCDLRFVVGKVEESLKNTINLPEKIAILRLDTDWYESTKIELEVLFPRLVKNGILIIDDYGHWKGCKKAVDEYFGKFRNSFLLSRIDYTGRLLIKNWEP
jgi:hypothetical protein